MKWTCPQCYAVLNTCDDAEMERLCEGARVDGDEWIDPTNTHAYMFEEWEEREADATAYWRH